MKTLIVQSLIIDQAEYNDQPSFNEYTDVIAFATSTVQKWAELNHYSYYLHTEPIIAADAFTELQSYGRCSAYYELQKLFVFNPDYDRICWIDPDVVVYGNPQLGSYYFSARFNDSRVIPITRPNSGIFYGYAEVFKDLYNYAINQLNYSTRDPAYQAWLEVPEGERMKRNSSQALMAYWVNQMNYKVKPMTKDLHTFFTYDIINNNSFIHLVGSNKYFKLCLLRWLLKSDDTLRSIIYDIINVQEVGCVQHTDDWYRQLDMINKTILIT